MPIALGWWLRSRIPAAVGRPAAAQGLAASLGGEIRQASPIVYANDLHSHFMFDRIASAVAISVALAHSRRPGRGLAMERCRQQSRLRFEALTFRDQLLLWSARTWILASPERPTLPPRVREAFQVAGVAEAADSLHELLSIISTSAHRTINFKPVACPMVAPEEARFLTLLYAAKEPAAANYACELLAGWVPPAAARLAHAAARTLAVRVFETLESSDPACTPGVDTDTRPVQSSPDPGLSLLH